jgi:hypothetical protein
MMVFLQNFHLYIFVCLFSYKNGKPSGRRFWLANNRFRDFLFFKDSFFSVDYFSHPPLRIFIFLFSVFLINLLIQLKQFVKHFDSFSCWFFWGGFDVIFIICLDGMGRGFWGRFVKKLI